MNRAWLAPLLLGVVAVVSGAGTAEAGSRYNRKNAIVEAYDKTKPSIVTINVDKRSGSSRKEIIGTGVIVDERGFIVTNRHVVSGADRITVVLYDNSEYTPDVVREDSLHDLAILRIKPTKKVQALQLAPAGDLMVGETVIAIGHPFGFTNTVSTGIVSALNRSVGMPTGETLTGLIQITASINPGNSGGPLLNINGELIGINVALREGAQGIAFALNADQVEQVLSRYLTAAKVAGVNHGLDVQEKLTPNDDDQRQRVVVEGVDAKSPAAAAGLHRGDQIVAIAAHNVSNRFDVERAFYDCKPGQTVDVVVLRDGKEIVVPMAVASDAGFDRVVRENGR